MNIQIPQDAFFHIIKLIEGNRNWALTPKNVSSTYIDLVLQVDGIDSQYSIELKTGGHWQAHLKHNVVLPFPEPEIEEENEE